MRILMVFLILNFCALSQLDSNRVFMNEFNFSVNHSNYNLEQNTFGFGVGVFHTPLIKIQFELVYGLEYNFSKQIQAYEFGGGHSGSDIDTSDFYLNLNAVSVPFFLKFNLGKKQNFFISQGVFIESIFNTKRTHNVSPEISDIITFSNGEFIKPFNFGGIVGVGFNYSLDKVEYYFKPELRFGVLNNRFFRICLGMRIK